MKYQFILQIKNYKEAKRSITLEKDRPFIINI